MEEYLKKFAEAAELIEKAKELIGDEVIGSGLREVHITDPPDELVKKHWELIVCRPRQCTDYPYEYSFYIGGINFFWLAKEKINND